MRIIIAGAGEVGSHLAKMLSIEANEITVIDSSSERLEALGAMADIVTVVGNPSSLSSLKEAGAENADLFIAVYPAEMQDVNIVSALLAKKLGSKKVTARINNEQYLSYDNKYLFTEMGLDLMFYPEKIAADEILDILNSKAAVDGMDFAHGKLHLAAFRLEDNSPIIDMTLIDMARNENLDASQFRVIAVSRNNDTIIPKPEFKFRYHDLVYIISKREGMEKIMAFMGQEEFQIRSTLIMGGSHTAAMVARSLISKDKSVKIIESSRERCNYLAKNLPEKVMIINGDGRDSDLLSDEDIRNYDSFVALTESSETNILACVAAKRMGVKKTIAKVENLEYISLAESMGVDAVINKKLITASRIFKFTLSDKVRSVKYLNGTNAEVIEFIAAPNSRITKASLMDLDFPKDAIIGGVIRGGDSFIAVGNTKIQEYDRVVVFALPQSVKEIDRWFR
ncbi:MAG: Trk system potassium transporter TrkA [Bacteroidales bacterium]|nr:Trk system potassium transporter TrkA [Bacteroidales bacterium]